MISLLLLKTVLSSVLLMHPVHETYSEIEWNEASSCCEVAMRIHGLDEQWMRRELKAEIGSQWQPDYLSKHVVFDRTETEGADGKRGFSGKPIRWIGRKIEGPNVWWFFEVECKGGVPPQTVYDDLLFDREDNYHHRFTILGHKDDSGKLPSVITSKDHPEASLEAFGKATAAEPATK
ncbi:DUF6702 family protein [Rhodopirellula sp. MGV]|uniref:DUF6702 family protein n=1 Tax=Rhodopirellula sp. MGV TaxID=2023130 RepID=UPI000B97734D|nr:DUF6702 family protein [Rhodopirellula sp. MGV]OYP36101.1 hypothetical protein CGZ80_10185 [Rhodopirellula sp. MGV]PNY36540.1 hypothetical protein C2E31_11820 [Rhodopirellula baltica]